jgi:hypothetical protein
LCSPAIEVPAVAKYGQHDAEAGRRERTTTGNLKPSGISAMRGATTAATNSQNAG